VEYWAAPGSRRLVDGTVGRAGHSLALLEAHADIELLAVDRDGEAVAAAERRFSGFGGRAGAVHGSYADLPELLRERGWGPVDGILLDLGVSSPQIDDPERGFSTRLDGPLDLRYDRDAGEPASAWLADAPVEEILRVLRTYGEEPRAAAVTRAIAAAREAGPIETTGELREIVAGVAGRRGEPEAKSLARVFQALRIAVNGELAELDRFLASLRDVLAPGGRIVILSYHSLEDRRVKRFLRDAARACVCPPELPVCACGGDRAWLRPLTKRAAVARPEEKRRNPRARSVRLRAAERVDTERE
jgi:16S rRNA (cytosine1402-N4)-methyltransferase